MTPPLAPIVSPIQIFPTILRDESFKSVPGQSLAMSVYWFAYIWHLILLSSFSLTLIPLNLLSTQHLKTWHRMKFLPRTFLQTAQGNLPSVVAFPAFSQIIIFVFLTFTLNPFDSSAPFPALSLPFRPTSVKTNATSSADNSFSGHPNLFPLDIASSTR